jgi:hypothetical protein
MKKEKLLGEHFVDYIGKLPDWRGQTQNVLIFEEIFQMFSYAEQFSAFLFSNSDVYNTGLQLQHTLVTYVFVKDLDTQQTRTYSRSQKRPNTLTAQ